MAEEQKNLPIEEKPAVLEAVEEEKTEQEKKKDRKKKLATAGVALFTSASVLVGGLFSSPDALLADEQNLNPIAITQNDNDNDLDGDGGDEEDSSDEEESEEEESESGGIRAGLREKILELPLAVRTFVLVPMWALGWAIWTVATGLWSMLLGPIVGKALSWLFLLAALLGAFALGVKAIFPNLPLKKIVNKKSLLGLLIGGLTLGAADLTLPLFWEGYEQVAGIVRASGVALILGTVCFAFLRRHLKTRHAETALAEGPAEPGEPEAEPEPKPWTREDIMALADTVSRKR